ncbi:MAG TPA: metallopeptidase TldD-related protein [Casimicrobiaceae bacterium]|nr:metallopeptidase TldD-related protein [Casimicrobiaceae bacterium]
MEAYFNQVAAVVDRALVAGERHATWFSAEQSDFVRMNRGKVRQPGRVVQRYLDIRLICGARHATHSLSLTGDLGVDTRMIQDVVTGLRSALPELADDPHLLLPSTVTSSSVTRGGGLPSAEAMVEAILGAAQGQDLVGLLAAGPVCRGFCNSEGQRNWHAVTTFNLQWSLYHRADKAIKSTYTGFTWDDTELRRRMDSAVERLALISRPPKSLQPGRYRAYLAPGAMEEIAGLLCWGGFSARALATQQSALAKMKNDTRLDRRISISEDTEGGVAPAFQAEGFVRPVQVPLIADGALVGSLVSPRTAREFELRANGANAHEMPEALAMAGGALHEHDALAALDTGLAIGNLHYLNYSDRPACRMTGMTRFATFWVENGSIVAPVDVLRFDDTIYRMLGANLEALTVERELLLESNTYGSRMLTSATLPGALLSEMQFTL